MAFKIEPAFNKTHGHYIQLVTTYSRVRLERISALELNKCIELFDKFKRDGVKGSKEMIIAFVQLKEKVCSIALLKNQQISYGDPLAYPTSLYQQGLSLAKNGKWQEALPQFIEAANLGFAPAFSRVWFCYAKGRGTSINYEEAKDWLFRGSVIGDAECQYQIANSYLGPNYGFQKNDEEGVKYLREAAQQGHGCAEALLAAGYYCGIYGLTKDVDQALSLYYRSMSRPLHRRTMESKIQIGQIQYSKGNYPDAVKLFQETTGPFPTFEEIEGPGVGEYSPPVPQGDSTSQYYLGECHSNGWGVPRNPREALKWYRLADQNGHHLAKQKIATLQSQLVNCASSEELNSQICNKNFGGVQSALSRGAIPDSRTLTLAFASMNRSIIDLVKDKAQPDQHTLTMACSTQIPELVHLAINLKARPEPTVTLNMARTSGKQEIIDAVLRVGAT